MGMTSEEESQKVITFERITNLLERNGRFQILVCLLICVNSAIVAFNHTLTTFHEYTPPYFCRDDNVTVGCVAGNETCDSGYEFEKPDITLVTQWELVCSRRYLRPLTSTLYFAGVTVGALIFGPVADKYGRRVVILVCLYVQAILGLSLAASTTLIMFFILRTLQGAFMQGLQSTSFTLLLEYCATRHRTAAGVIWEIYWAFGCILLGILAYFIRDWRYLQLALAIPSVLTLLYIWVIPESPIWLMSLKKYAKAQLVSDKISRLNGYDTPLTTPTKRSLPDTTSIGEKEETSSETPLDTDAGSDESLGFYGLIKYSYLRKHTLIMSLVWFSVTISYYGTLFFLPNLSGQRHVNFLLGAAVEVVAYILAYWILSRFGRRIPMVVYQIFCAVVCGIVALVIGLKLSQNGWLGPAMTVLIQLSKGSSVSCFCCMYIYTGELFPTVVRGSAIGLFGFFSRVGSLLAPQLNILGEYTDPSLPLAILAVLILLSGLASLGLPETLNKPLTNTLEDAKARFGKNARSPVATSTSIHSVQT